MSQYNKHLQGYQQVRFNTASPQKLLIMCYDGAIQFLKKADIMMEKEQYDKANYNILRSMAFITELLATLDDSKSPEFTSSLRKLYLYIIERLRDTMRSQNRESMRESIRLLSSLKETWETAFRNMQAQQKIAV